MIRRCSNEACASGFSRGSWRVSSSLRRNRAFILAIRPVSPIAFVPQHLSNDLRRPARARFCGNRIRRLMSPPRDLFDRSPIGAEPVKINWTTFEVRSSRYGSDPVRHWSVHHHPDVRHRLCRCRLQSPRASSQRTARTTQRRMRVCPSFVPVASFHNRQQRGTTKCNGHAGTPVAAKT